MTILFVQNAFNHGFANIPEFLANLFVLCCLAGLTKKAIVVVLTAHTSQFDSSSTVYSRTGRLLLKIEKIIWCPSFQSRVPAVAILPLTL